LRECVCINLCVCRWTWVSIILLVYLPSLLLTSFLLPYTGTYILLPCLYLFIYLFLPFSTFLYLFYQELGKLLALHKKDKKLQKTVKTLASIPEIFQLINCVIKRNFESVDGDHLNFIFAHTNILNLENKLAIASKILKATNLQGLKDSAHYRTYDTDDSTGGEEPAIEYPIIRSQYATKCIYLSRKNTWKSFFFFACGFNDKSGEGKKRLFCDCGGENNYYFVLQFLLWATKKYFISNDYSLINSNVRDI
jgi:hypothetical protein